MLFLSCSIWLRKESPLSFKKRSLSFSIFLSLSYCRIVLTCSFSAFCLDDRVFSLSIKLFFNCSSNASFSAICLLEFIFLSFSTSRSAEIYYMSSRATAVHKTAPSIGKYNYRRPSTSNKAYWGHRHRENRG